MTVFLPLEIEDIYASDGRVVLEWSNANRDKSCTIFRLDRNLIIDQQEFAGVKN
ncbi:MAG: hypothetical protein V4616_03755 [Bacteroidota bacterium]